MSSYFEAPQQSPVASQTEFASKPRQKDYKKFFNYAFCAWIAFLICTIGLARWFAENDLGIWNILTLFTVAALVLSLAIYFAFLKSVPLFVRMFPISAIGVSVLVFLLFFRIRWTGGMVPIVELRSKPVPPLKISVKQPVAEPARSGEFDYPQFLGPNRNQVVNSVKLARNWKDNPPKLVWKHEIGEGWSGFAVKGWRVVTLEQRDENELVTCYHLRTGEALWSFAHPDVRFDVLPSGAGPRSVPAIVGDRVYAMGATGILDCLDLETGERIWTRDFYQHDPTLIPKWGQSCSPLVDNDRVIVSVGLGKGKSLMALDAKDGAELWSHGDDYCSYSSPSIATLNGVRQILIVNQDAVAGHDAATGFLLWRFPWPGKTDSNANIAQAFGADESRVFVSKSYGTGAALFHVTHDGVGNWGTSSEKKNAKNAWAKPVLKTKLNNLSRLNNLLFGLDEEILSCVDLEDGKKYWKDRTANAGQGQLLLVGDLLLVQAEDGRLLLVEATNKKYNELGRFKAIEGKPCWNPPAFAPPYFLLRNHEQVACYELPLEASSEKTEKKSE